MRPTVAITVYALLSVCPGALAQEVQPYGVVWDAIPDRLGGLAGDPERGRAVVLDRRAGNCLICHRVPVPDELFQGDLGPDLSGVGDRLTPGEIRLRLVDAARINPSTLMPPYYRTSGLRHVPERYRGRAVLDAQAIEDAVSWLATLRDGSGKQP